MRERLFTVSHRLQAEARFHTFSGKPGPVVPYLRLSGRWLGGLGFAIGSKVRVSAEPGRLVLELAEPPGEVAEASAEAVLGSVTGNDRRERRACDPPQPKGSRRRSRGASLPATAGGPQPWPGCRRR